MTQQIHAGRDPIALGNIRALAEGLGAEGRAQDALLLLEFLAAVDPGNADTLRSLVRMLGAEGRMLEALERLCEVKAASTDMAALLGSIAEQMPAVLERFNSHLAAGDVAEAEELVAALVALIPRNRAVIEAAHNCNLALGRAEKVSHYAAMLRLLDAVAQEDMERQSSVAPPAKIETHPLVRLRDLHDEISALLCEPLTGQSAQRVEALLRAGRQLVVAVPPGSEWEAWEKHYRLMLDAIDLRAVQGATPAPRGVPKIKFATSAGAPANWLALRAAAARLGAEAVFFAAADQAYIDLYARWYVKSILEHSDVACLVVLHVIGGADRLAQVAKTLGIRDKRLFLAGDDFDAGEVTTQCFDAPPKGKIEKPVAHFQSIRFLRLGSLLQALKRPVFVSDIDLLLQRGVKELMTRVTDADIVLNRNEASRHAGSQLTANLLLVKPTDDAAVFLDFLGGFLERQLGKPEVSRWIDQLALLLARHHLLFQRAGSRIAYFDTSRDINNVMYPSYQDNPFTFLSLYHGFDLSSLEGNGKAVGEARQRRSGKRPARHG